MILGGAHQAAGSEGAGDHATLDDLFRRAAVRHVDALALADPPNRESFTDGAPRRLTYAQADRAISAMAAKLRRLGLQTDAVVAMQLPNTVESIITLLGVLRAGMIAAPLPLLWRKQDIVTALKPLGPKALITSSRIGSAAHADIAMQAAAEIFPVRYVGCFGNDWPDGVVPFDDIFTAGPLDFEQMPGRVGNAAEQIAAVTFDQGAKGIFAMARNHRELIAGALGAHLQNGAPQDGHVLSAIPLGSFAGIALTPILWMLGGGTLSLHHAFDPDSFSAQAHQHDGGTVVLPGPALLPLAQANGRCRPASVIALWRSPERLAGAARWQGRARLVDVASFGEIGFIAAARGSDGIPSGIPAGPIDTPDGITVVETMRNAIGTLALRGAMVPSHAFPPGAEGGGAAHAEIDAMGFADTGFRCRLDGARITITAPPAGISSVGGYRLQQSQADATVAEVDPNATLVALPDTILGQRLAGSAEYSDAVRTDLQTRGVNPLIAAAFIARAIPDAA